MPDKKPEDCNHFTVRHMIDGFYCLDCGLEFIPKQIKYRGIGRKWPEKQK